MLLAQRPKLSGFLIGVLRTSIVLLLVLCLLVVWMALVNRDHLLSSAPQLASVDSIEACQELLVNGTLEDSSGWQFVTTPAPGTRVGSPVHAGVFAMRLGIASDNNAVADSTASQSVALPANAQQILLTYWEKPGATGDSGDYREVIVLRPNLTVLRSLTRQTAAGNDQWTQRTFDLTDLKGQTGKIYFNVHNNGAGPTLVNYLDDISLQSCDSTTPATATTLPSATPSLTPIPSPATTTPTPLPNAVTLRIGTVTLNSGQVSVTVPLDLLNASDQRAVGLLSADVLYDSAQVKATGCVPSVDFDLLLCNLAKPGVIQLAGVAAEGIRRTTRVADLSFELLQPVDLNNPLVVPLTVKLDAVGNTDGVALSANAQNGQIGTLCQPSGGACQKVYLPVIQR